MESVERVSGDEGRVLGDIGGVWRERKVVQGYLLNERGDGRV